jgi:probable HAF family extracellular repeat protein
MQKTLLAIFVVLAMLAGQAVLADTSAFLWTPNSGLHEIGSSMSARAVNNRGQVCGETWVGNPFRVRAYVWSARGGTSELETIAGFDGSNCFAISEQGDAAGASFTMAVSGDFRVTAVHWRRGTAVALGSTDWNSAALGMNERGQVVGWQEVDGGVRHAHLWGPQVGSVDLGTLGGLNSVATAVNNRCQVVGYGETVTGALRGFVWSARRGMRDIGTLGGADSQAFGINEWGGVVGKSDVASGEAHAFLWLERHGFLDLGRVGESAAFGVSNVGQVVGVTVDDAGRFQANRWSGHSSEAIEIPTGAIDSLAWGTNDRGQVAGNLNR